MQTDEWIAYLDSLYFSDRFSYKILCIPTNGLKDINFARFKHFLEFSEKEKHAAANWAEGVQQAATCHAGREGGSGATACTERRLCRDELGQGPLGRQI
jgi:hypothetical protein